ncbi:MAG: iron-sulfur cluster repair di-iron protein [Bacteroidetes bacterium]|nr:iron-sulfur cluster repair di-iron protein [Bacteroidota bacterium]MBU1372691.1 iron-sulfur cluster repair di-iron protein [Bacteroidota bacterium]MBU1484887.1 iron-sulfur cluster repair di-iron protein [Bacteroidota bacterium]MBU1762004.1 iron-sulfur cluster repair di-iron protein [Bacteroidota bacterium]MBU2266513.1 iron-sulfur cluster repair di-iron protein [Bacteroidota bacterium]
MEILDVTLIEPRFKHPAIFKKFDELADEKAFIINNDHDPKPLYYQLLAERGQIFTWEYLENGPETWQVKIQKKLNQNEETIGEMVTKDFRKAQVFKKLGIDFCCGGKKTLKEVCDKKGIDLKKVEEELRSFNEKDNTTLDFNQMELDFLSDYIVNIHHKYVKESLPFMTELATKVAKVHGDQHPELLEVARIFNSLAQDFGLHLMKEENILFPYIKELVTAKKEDKHLPTASFGKVNNPTQMMETEHEQAGVDMGAIRKLTNNYQLPQDACNSYRILFKKLAEFENDLFNHVHLENNILFPKSIVLEKEIIFD